MLRRILLASTASCALWACGKGAKAPVERPAPKTEQPASQPISPRPRLVVAIMLDQFPSSALLRYADTLAENGPLRTAMREGAVFERVRFAYAGTNTGPGHASIHTGKLPAEHGIDSNDVYDYQRGDRLSIVDDGKHPVFGLESEYASPMRLLAPTVGDRLHEAHPDSRVVSISHKDRAAVLSGGRTADFVAWYEADKPGFVTSSYYGPAEPEWFRKWNADHPVSARFGDWTADDPALYQRLLGKDDQDGESRWHGLDTTFPHPAGESESPHKTFIAVPQSVDYLLDLARAAAQEYQLGKDDHPDLLCISISTTDYAAHSYSVESWEYLDVLRRADRSLASFLAELAQSTDLAVLVTSDHGGGPLPEKRRALGLSGGRLDKVLMVDSLDARLDKVLGKGDWVQAYIQPYLYLTPAAQTVERQAKVAAVIEKFVAEEEGVHGIYPAALARQWRNSAEVLEREIAATVAETTTAWFVVPAEGWMPDPWREPGKGTGHGTPWEPDREVPVLFYGAGVAQHREPAAQDHRQVAPTIAALLGLSWTEPFQALVGAPASRPAAKKP